MRHPFCSCAWSWWQPHDFRLPSDCGSGSIALELGFLVVGEAADLWVTLF